MTPTPDPQITAAEDLLVILKREHKALLAGDLAGIEAIVPEKRAATARLEALAHATASPANPPRLRELAIACRKQNEINGGMVAIGLQHTQRLLSLLRGQSPEEDLYTRSGQTSMAPGSLHRPLASA